jgi:hypothetical protein
MPNKRIEQSARTLSSGAQLLVFGAFEVLTQ